MAANVGSAVLMVWSFHRRLPEGLVVWAATVSGMSLLTLLRCWRACRRKVLQASIRTFRRATWHACLLAAAWAVMPVLWFPHGTPDEQITIAALTTGMLSAGAFLLSPMPIASLAYGGIYAAAAIIALLRTGDSSLFATVALMAIYAPTVLIGAMSSWHKATVQLAVQGQIARRERLVALLLQDFEEQANEALWEVGADRRLRHFSPRLAEFLGVGESDLRSRRFVDVLADVAPHLGAAVDDIRAKGVAFRDVRFSVDHGGQARHFRISGKRVFDEAGHATGWRGIVTDVTAENEHERRLVELAHTDSLTGLANRTTLRDSLGRRLASCVRGALLTIDLDHFKSINDALGHSVGDELLAAVGARLHQLVRVDDVVARMGGDEFAVVMAPLRDAGEAERLADGLLSRLREPYQVGSRRLEVGASIGVALWPDHAGKAEDLLLQSDVALYHAKQLGRGRLAIYDADLGARAQRRLQIEEGLRESLVRGELQLFWQPKVATGSNRIVGAEALLRWAHPELGAVPPSEFIPIAEECGLIHELGAWALREACRVGAEVLPQLSVAVNVSTVQLLSGHLPGQLRDALASTAMTPSRLELEITESVFLDDPVHALEQLESIRRHGVRLALDDFGTGYSSLAFLRRFPFSTIKIDRSFVVDMPSQPDARLMVNTIVLMADAMGMHTVCEGVETGQQLTEVIHAGCQEYQGYLASPPLPIEAFLEFHRSWRGAAWGQQHA
ncbi:MAG: EAL domain-containing protein [Xanthomonadaceae bacterium]|nr:EAL domain-containing protein [Xanthomonadaceae bacterium]MDE1962671.1 EAL domain-containing protein [Xanthomonadaceae bacterium]